MGHGWARPEDRQPCPGLCVFIVLPSMSEGCKSFIVDVTADRHVTCVVMVWHLINLLSGEKESCNMLGVAQEV
jgi:hypothetical protein